MRIAVNCQSFVKKQYTGIGRYAYHLVKNLSEIDTRNEYKLYARKGPLSFNKKAPRFAARNFTTCVDWRGRGFVKTIKAADLCHFPSPGPLRVPPGARIVVSVHDVIFKAFPQGHTKETILAGEEQFAEIRKKADKVICCSRATALDLKKYFQIPDDRIELVYQGVDKDIFRRLDEKEMASAGKVLARHGVKEPFILSVGTIEPRKNLVSSIRAFHALKAGKEFSGQLVVAGMKGWLNDGLTALIDELGFTRDVIFLGYVSDTELCALYNKAEAFVFPSFYEGFGFPILEAFCCGAPVVTSNVSSCPEVAGDAALTVDPGSFKEIADAVSRILADEGLRKTLREKAFKRARDFDFRKTAQETLRVYESVGGR
jgi:glycosyltransferase involved in cell wall biosynthesis